MVRGWVYLQVGMDILTKVKVDSDQFFQSVVVGPQVREGLPNIPKVTLNCALIHLIFTQLHISHSDPVNKYLQVGHGVGKSG